MDFSELLSLERCHFSNEIFVAFELICVTSLYGSLKIHSKITLVTEWQHLSVKFYLNFIKKICGKALFICVSVKDYKPYLLTSEYSVASHNYNFCSLKNFSYHLILISSSINEILQKWMIHLFNIRQWTAYTPYMNISFLSSNGRSRTCFYSIEESGTT